MLEVPDLTVEIEGFASRNDFACQAESVIACGIYPAQNATLDFHFKLPTPNLLVARASNRYCGGPRFGDILLGLVENAVLS